MSTESEHDQMRDENTRPSEEKEEKKHKKHKKHKHHKSHKKHDRRRSRSRSPSPVLGESKRRYANSELHQLAKEILRRRSDSRDRSSSRSSRREKSPDLSIEERDLRTVLCKFLLLFIVIRTLSFIFLLGMQLAARIRPRDLEEFFSRVGKVRDVRLITDPRTRRSKGVAYVEFRDLSSVQRALALSGEKLLGIPIIVKPSNAEKNRIAAQAAAANRVQANLLANGMSALTCSAIPEHGPMRLYVGSLHFNINEEMLRAIFEPFGRIDNVTLMRDSDTGRSRGYGFIQFAHAEDAKRAMENLNGFEVAGRPMKVSHVTERAGEVTTPVPYPSTTVSAFPSTTNLDSDELDKGGIVLGTTGRLALMAKLSEGSGLEMPKFAREALQAAHMQAAGSQCSRIVEPPNPQQLATATAVGTQCFMLSNMFDPDAEAKNSSRWVEEIRDDVIAECQRFGGVVHIYVDEKSKEGNVYVKCPTIVSGEFLFDRVGQ